MHYDSEAIQPFRYNLEHASEEPRERIFAEKRYVLAGDSSNRRVFAHLDIRETCRGYGT